MAPHIAQQTVWAGVKLQMVRTFSDPDFIPQAADICPKHNVVVALQHVTGRAYIAWDADTGAVRYRASQEVAPPIGPIVDLEIFGEPESILAPLSSDPDGGTFGRIRVSDGRPLVDFGKDDMISVWPVTIDGGRSVLAGCKDGAVRVWNSSLGNVRYAMQVTDRPILAVAVDDESSKCVAHAWSGLLAVLDLKSHRRTKAADLVMDGRKSLAATLVWGNRGESVFGTIIAPPNRGSVIIDANGLNATARFSATTMMNRLAVGGSGRQIVFGDVAENGDKRLRLLRTGANTEASTLGQAEKVIVGAAMSADGSMAAAQSFSNLDAKIVDGSITSVFDRKATDIQCRIDLFYGDGFSKSTSITLGCKEVGVPIRQGLRFAENGMSLVVATGSSVVLLRISEN